MLSIFGGKLTTYRRLAEHALEKLAPHLPAALQNKGWSGQTPLPGGDFAVEGFAVLVRNMARAYPWLTADHVERLCRLYGTRMRDLLRTATSAASLGRNFGATLTEAEIDYLMREEWAECAEDVVWRRTKLGLLLTEEQIVTIDAYISERRAAAEAA